MEIGEDGTVCYPAGYVHLPKVDAECLKQLYAEQLVTRRDRNGFPVREWQKMRERNEALDGYVYARAAAAAAGLDRFEERHWRELERQLGIRSPMQTEAQAAAGASDPGSPGTSDKRTRPRRLMVGTLKTRAMTIAKGIHYPVGGNAVAVPLRCDADGRVYLADYEPPSANLSVETAVGPLRANATAVSETLDLGSSPRHTLLLARKIGVASNGETIEVQSSPDEAAWTVCPDAAGDTGLAQQQYAIGQAMHVMQARPMDRYVRTSFKNGVTAQTALVLHLTALAGA